jgi:putative membrane protein
VEIPHTNPQHISDHLANERTILAWIRTAIAVITLGVAINRFSLFLMEFHQIAPQMRSENRHAETVGVGLVVLGLVIMCGAIWHYLHVANTIDRQTYRAPRLVMALTSLAVVVVGGSALIWLF